MRLREPLQGYKLSSGHYLFHLAYIFGALNAWYFVLARKRFNGAKITDEIETVFWELVEAHIIVPIFTLLGHIFYKYEYHVMSKCMDIRAIGWY